MPKAVLQKFCQRLGWEAPKYSKISEKGGKFVYAVNILRGATGRGKSRKAGGLTKIQLPEIDEEYGSVEVTFLLLCMIRLLINILCQLIIVLIHMLMVVNLSCFVIIAIIIPAWYNEMSIHNYLQ